MTWTEAPAITTPGSSELNLDREQFLARHWQRKPLLIRNAVPGFTPPVSADQLAGLAMEAEIESRIIERRGDNWTLTHGPFSESDFRRQHPWTLLVQAVDQALPEVAALRELVDFLPTWRIDDIMVSYAVDGGSVGPHYDNYDVFLLQGEGRRRWRLGPWCDSDAPLGDHDELRILRDFRAEQDYLLECGDILYVPPRFAHWGVAEGECTTFSIGFRAPRINDMVSHWIDGVLQDMDPEEFYADASREAASRAGEIRPHDIERARMQIDAALDQYEQTSWFGELVTQSQSAHNLEQGEYTALRRRLHSGQAVKVEVIPGTRLAWQQEPDSIRVFANGDHACFEPGVLPLVIRLCQQDCLSLAGPDAGELSVLEFLLANGALDVE